MKKEVPKEISLLDAKRAMNTAIAIARIKMTFAETRQAIMNMDETALSSNVLQSLQARFVIYLEMPRFSLWCDPPFSCAKWPIILRCGSLRVDSFPEGRQVLPIAAGDVDANAVIHVSAYGSHSYLDSVRGVRASHGVRDWRRKSSAEGKRRRKVMAL